MTRCLTERELEYLNRLVKRNREAVNFEPLTYPASPREEAMRLRLRLKAYRMLLDLFKMDKAGIINYGELEDCTVENIRLLLSDAEPNEDKMQRKMSLLLS